MTVSGVAPARSGKLELGRVIARVVRVLIPQAPTYFLLGLITVGLVDLVFGYLRFSGRIVESDDLLSSFRGAPGEFAASGLAAVFFMGGAIQAALARLLDRPIGFGEMARASSRFFPRMFAITLLTNIAVTIGLFLLIIPGLILWARWSVSGPVGVAENRPYGRAMARSVELTDGHRGLIILLCVLGFAAIMGVSFALLTLAEAVDAGIGRPGLTGYFVAVPLGTIFAVALSAAGRTAIYEELVLIKQGGREEDVAQVFA